MVTIEVVISRQKSQLYGLVGLVIVEHGYGGKDM